MDCFFKKAKESGYQSNPVILGRDELVLLNAFNY